MFTGLLKRFLEKTAVIIAGVSILLTMGLVNVHAAKPPPTPLSCSISPADGAVTAGVPITFTATTQGGKGGKSYSWNFSDGSGSPSSSSANPIDVTYNSAGGPFTVLLDVTDKQGTDASCSTTVTVNGGGGNTSPVANDDADSTTIDTAVTTNVVANDTDADGNATIDATSVVIVTDPNNGTAVENGDGTVTYTPDAGWTGVDSYGYTVDDDQGATSNEATVTITVNEAVPPIDPGFAAQTDFKIMMNYELGMHCTGFEFAYCCVLPAYNSILAQVVKPNQSAAQHGGDFPMLMEGDPNEGLDALGRETVVRDKGELDASGNFKKYVLKYWHEAQPRNDGRGKPQSSLLISAVEGNSLMSWNTTFDSAALNADGTFVMGEYNGAQKVMLGDGDTNDPSDNYQNAVWNHLYFYENLEGDNSTGTSADVNKIRLGVSGQPVMDVVFPSDCGPALHPMGPTTQNGDPNGPEVANNCGGFSNGNVLTFSGHKGTVVYTQMKVLENLPIMLTSPDIWEALGLPLTPFEDSIDFFSDPGLLNEDSVRPFVAMKAQMYDYDPAASDGAGAATLDSAGDPVIGFGTAPIDIPNCERCHSNPVDGTMIDNAANEGGGQLMVINSPNADPAQYAMVVAEYNYWNAFYNIDKTAGDSDWYSRLKSAAISMLNGHDVQHGTSFAANYPGTDVAGEAPQNTRLGHESVICQRCHADNVIAAVKSAECGPGSELGTEICTAGTLIMPITEAIHRNHGGISTGGPIAFDDSLGRDGGCQGCHPAHRSDGDMNGYPITLAGGNRYADGDNRGANGGCFVGRDVHSNPGKDSDGAETPEHLNAVGQYLADNVANDGNGIWCTNCHNQLGQELWKAENMESLVHGIGLNNPRAEPTLAAVAAAVGVSEEQAIAWVDPTTTNPLGDFSRAIWDADPGLCNYVAGYFGVIPVDPAHDGNVATVEVNVTSAEACSTGGGTGQIDCGADYPGAPAFHICGSVDVDGDFSVSALDFCTTPDCVTAAQATLPAGSVAVPVPFSAATDGRDHWLSAGEPHCADCHSAPFVEQSGNINAYPPFNYPRKASLMRYSRGHQDISCQGCHESIHGLYPVTPNIDTTSYAQAAALNHDGSHGPLKCGTCHEVDSKGIPTWMQGVKYNGNRIRSYDDAVAWMHTFTDEVSPLEGGGVCENCHGDRSSKMGEDKGKWLRHSFVGRIGRDIQDKAEIDYFGHVAGGDFVDADDLGGLTSTVCTACHSLQGGPDGAFVDLATCDNAVWKSHNIDGRLAEKVWEYVSVKQNGTTCGW